MGFYKKDFIKTQKTKKKTNDEPKNSKLSKGDQVKYTKTKGAGLKIPFQGSIISIDKDGQYATIRNQIRDIDYIPVRELIKIT